MIDIAESTGIQGGRYLHERHLDEVLDDHTLLCDPQKAPRAIFYPSLANAGDHVPAIYLQMNVETLLDAIANGYENLSYSDVVRHTLVLGYSLYQHEIGNMIEDLYARKRAAIISGNQTAILDDQISCKQPSGHIKIPCRISGHLFEMITRGTKRSGICKGQFAGYLITKALLTHNEVQGTPWVEKLASIVNEYEDRIKHRIDKMR